MSASREFSYRGWDRIPLLILFGLSALTGALALTLVGIPYFGSQDLQQFRV